jgi:cytochrome P450
MKLPPYPTPDAGRAALKALLAERSLLPALQALYLEMGPVFRLSAPGFKPIVLAGPEAAHFVLVESRDNFNWRNESDPVTGLLRRGVLVTDGDEHDQIRRVMSAPLHRQRVLDATEIFWRQTDRISDYWLPNGVVDMLVEMRKVALLILMDALFDVDMTPDLDRLFPDILKTLKFISPGLWLVWKGAPRLGYQRSMDNLDQYIYGIITNRRERQTGGDDLLSRLIASGMDDDLIRDQVLTMMIAGHDTSTALLAWALWLLGSHPEAMKQARSEVESVLGNESPGPQHLEGLEYLDQVVSETLRLYPPIHVGNRLAARDLEFAGFTIPAGERVMISIYATQRDPAYWQEPGKFNPDRFAPGSKPKPYTYLPFGGGPRNCIGAAFARVEARIVLARLLQRFDLTLQPGKVRQYMGATLEPRPGVFMTVKRRS